jgi:hypothetical protein
MRWYIHPSSHTGVDPFGSTPLEVLNALNLLLVRYRKKIGIPQALSPACFNPILHTWFRDSCFTCDGSSTIQVFPLLFNIGMVI